MALVFKHLLSDDDDAAEVEVDIVRALLKVLSPGRMPKIEEGIAYDDMLDLWERKDDAKMLEDAKGIHHRYQGAESLLMASPLAIWPPPLELVVPGVEICEGASVCWEVRFGAPVTEKALMDWAIGSLDQWKGTTWFRKGKHLFPPFLFDI